jgi:hypothetical protein
VPLWTRLYARDVEKEIAKRLRVAWAAEIRQALQAALATRTKLLLLFMPL